VASRQEHPRAILTRLALVAMVVVLPASAGDLSRGARRAANHFGIPDQVMFGIALAERGWAGASLVNKDGSRDLGPMQINTIRLSELEPLGITEAMIRDDACTNFAVAAWLLRQHYNETHDCTTAVGHYHSRLPEHSAAYIELVRAQLRDMLGHQCTSGRIAFCQCIGDRGFVGIGEIPAELTTFDARARSLFLWSENDVVRLFHSVAIFRRVRRQDVALVASPLIHHYPFIVV
jgi:hypothetical protein